MCLLNGHDIYSGFEIVLLDCAYFVAESCCIILSDLHMCRTIHICTGFCVITGNLNAEFHVACAQIKHVVGDVITTTLSIDDYHSIFSNAQFLQS